MAAQGREGSRPSAIRRARRVCILIVFSAIIVGLVLRLGLGTLSSLGVGAIAYLCPVGALETLLAGREVIPRVLLSLACIILLIALVGRLFCSWVCIIPPLTRFFHPKEAKERIDSVAEEAQGVEGDLTHDAHGSQASPADGRASCAGCAACGSHAGADALAPVGGKRDGLQIDSRHGVLAGALISSLVCGFPVFCLICPIGLTFALVIGIYQAIFEQNPTVSLLVFALVLLVELVFFRKWCRRICPIGALMSLVGVKAPLAKPRVDAKKCLRSQGIDCKACVQVCPEELDPHMRSIPECTKCGICMESCPARAISFRKPRKRIPEEASAPAEDGQADA